MSASLATRNPCMRWTIGLSEPVTKSTSAVSGATTTVMLMLNPLHCSRSDLIMWGSPDDMKGESACQNKSSFAFDWQN